MNSLVFAAVDAALEEAALAEFRACPVECWNPDLCGACCGGALRLGAWRALWMGIPS